MAEGSARRLAIGLQTTASVRQTALKTLRNTGGSGISNERTSITSEEFRSDRAIVESRLGTNAPTISVPIEFSYNSFEDIMAAAIGHGDTWTDVTYTANSTLDIDVDAATKIFTLATSTWLAKGVRVGDNITFAGFSEAENNIAIVVTNLDGDALTAGDAEGLTTDTAGTGFTQTTPISNITCSTTDLSFTIEEGFTDIEKYHYTTGAYVNTWAMSIQPDSIVTGSFDFQGLTYVGFSDTAPSSSVAAANTNNIFDSYTGVAYVEGVAGSCVITGLDFSVDNGLTRRYALMKQDACSMGQGRINVTGTINAYFQDATMADLYADETEFKVSVRLEDLDGNSYVIGFPKVKLTGDTRDISENDVTESLPFQALGGDADTTMYVRKQAAS